MEINFKDLIVIGIKNEIQKTEANNAENEEKIKQLRKSVSEFEQSKMHKKFLEDQKAIEEYTPNNDTIKLKRLKQQLQYVESEHYDSNKTDVQKAKEYLQNSSYSYKGYGKKKINTLKDHELIEEANQIRVHELIDRKLEENDGYIDFKGQNCVMFGNTCAGWSGEGRCECGNRRVSWEGTEDVYFLDDDTSIIYGEAY